MPDISGFVQCCNVTKDLFLVILMKNKLCLLTSCGTFNSFLSHFSFFQIDMVQIKECFLKLTGKTLWRWLKEDTSFNFKKLLQKIVGCD